LGNGLEAIGEDGSGHEVYFKQEAGRGLRSWSPSTPCKGRGGISLREIKEGGKRGRF